MTLRQRLIGSIAIGLVAGISLSLIDTTGTVQGWCTLTVAVVLAVLWMRQEAA